LRFSAVIASEAKQSRLTSWLLDCFASLAMTPGKVVGETDVMRDFVDATGSYGRLLEKSSRLAMILQVSNAGRSNGWVAARLRQAASLLAAQDANPFRIFAYRRAGDAIERLDADLRDLAEAGGHASLEAIPGVGPSIAGAVAEMLSTGRWGFLDRLKGAAEPEALCCAQHRSGAGAPDSGNLASRFAGGAGSRRA